MGLIASTKRKKNFHQLHGINNVKGTVSHFELDFLKTKAPLTIKGEDSGKSVTRPPSWKFGVGLKLESVPMIVFGSFNFFGPIEYKLKGRSFLISTQTTFSRSAVCSSYALFTTIITLIILQKLHQLKKRKET